MNDVGTPKLIVALDVEELAAAQALVRTLAPLEVIFKLRTRAELDWCTSTSGSAERTQTLRSCAKELNRSRGRASSRWLGGVIVGSAVTGRERPV